MGPQDLLDALDEIVYVSDPNTYELLYANRRCRSLLPTRDYKGKPCYALLQGQPAPCPYCTNARLTPDKFYVWEFNNPSMGRHFLLKDKLIDWDGRPARLEIAVDITEQELLSRDTARKLETERTLVECIRRLMDAASSREAAPGRAVLCRRFLSGISRVPAGAACFRQKRALHPAVDGRRRGTSGVSFDLPVQRIAAQPIA